MQICTLIINLLSCSLFKINENYGLFFSLMDYPQQGDMNINAMFGDLVKQVCDL